jgi:hypothetical protein
MDKSEIFIWLDLNETQRMDTVGSDKGAQSAEINNDGN